MSQAWTLHTCGARGSRPVCGVDFLEFGGATTCYVLRKGDHALIIDCGSGLSRAGEILKGCRKIDVFLTHLHYDHILGLLAWSVFPRDAEIRFFGTFLRWLDGRGIEEFFRPPFWPVIPDIGPCLSIESPGSIKLSDEICVSSFPSCHPNDSNILRIDTKEKSLCVLFDYEHGDDLPESVTKGCSLMIYDGMYTKEEYPRYIGWGHSCWEEGCRLAKERGICEIIITHHAPDRTDQELRKMEERAKKCFPGLRFARMGDRMIL